MEGPIHLKFSKDISITLLEMKIVKNKEPIVLLGTDTMVVSADNKAWHFVHMGLNLHNRGSIV